jgi:undecaprenyl-diphosphatase
LAAALSNNLKYALPALALGFGMSHSRKDRETAVQVVDSLLVSQTATELLKVTIRDPRPEGREGFGFPSGHTSAAFAVATVLAKKRPRHRWLYYGLAAAVAWSRVERGAHDLEDVLGGAALGLAAGHHSASRPGGLILAEIRF